MFYRILIITVMFLGINGPLYAGVGGGAFLHSKAFQPKVIYGKDNRQELYQVQDKSLKTLSRSVAMVVDKSDIFGSPQDPINSLRLLHAGDDFNLCRDELFYNQYMSGFCTAFLVADDIMATAGHCFKFLASCYTSAFVFDWHSTGAHQVPTSTSTQNIYSCKEVIVSQTDPRDYALIRLDRKVTDRQPLKLRPSARVAEKEEVFSMGHPFGLPLKVVREAHVRRSYRKQFVTNLDTYQGNSGSPIISESTHEVLGILTGGDNDLDYDGDRKCYMSKQCGEHECDGETAVKTSILLKFLKEIKRKKRF